MSVRVCVCSSPEAKRRDPPKHPRSLGRAEPRDRDAVGHVAAGAEGWQEQDAAASGRGHAAHGGRPGPRLLPETEVPVQASEFQSG